MRNNYKTVFKTNNGTTMTAYFYNKKDAINFALMNLKKTTCFIVSMRTEKKTYILPRELSSCMVCGNELNGKKFCGLCKTQHIYS